MRLLTLNLRHGGGRRMEALARALLARQADVLLLTEFRNNPAGAMLRERLAARGFAHQAVSQPEPRINSVLLAARQSFKLAPHRLLRFDPARLLSARFAQFNLVGVHLPNIEAKKPHWEALLKLARARAAAPRLFLGDFNTGRDDLDAPGFRFFGARYMEALESQGWVEAWRHLHPRRREYSWYSHRGRGFRLDHVFLSPPLLPALRNAAYAHGVRRAGHTDHSALVVDLALG